MQIMAVSPLAIAVDVGPSLGLKASEFALAGGFAASGVRAAVIAVRPAATIGIEGVVPVIVRGIVIGCIRVATRPVRTPAIGLAVIIIEPVPVAVVRPVARQVVGALIVVIAAGLYEAAATIAKVFIAIIVIGIPIIIGGVVRIGEVGVGIRVASETAGKRAEGRAKDLSGDRQQGERCIFQPAIAVVVAVPVIARIVVIHSH